ncbi:arginine--tRNA ligase [Apibacter sp. B2966]|uniref:arginine--tRNA ligase n=1 Tax=Apibacter sp. B2966 TaxID=2656761 RepID=UPI00140A09BF|nr:arginine--tRNA ligase [Apibacter sp. B2966]QII72957.1 arginine--tRNA ligase [Apibacter sp. B2966]
MNLKSYIKEQSIQAIENLFQHKVEDVEIQITKDEFEGDYTLVVFPFVKLVKQKPEEIANKIGSYLTAKEEFVAFNVVKGFLNLSLNPTVFTKLLKEKYSVKDFKLTKKHTEKIMVEYSSPNTNKPIHLGHIRNNLLGFSISNILKAAGNEVLRGQIINDRGIHICKSMLAWKKYGNGETPQTTGIKGDHLVGKYYVIFDQKYKEEIQSLISSGLDADEAKKKAPILLEAQEMLKKWEDGDAEIKALWKEMNSWVYLGFEKTYQRLGVSYDLVQYESDTYLLGKDVIEEGLKKGILFKKEDGSVWADLTEEGLDQKLLLRGDGTSVYITQDLGTAVERFTRYHLNELIYTVGNEQDYHFQVLFLILKKLGYQWADKLYHLSYGMVDLPSGKMKSREGTVVDADELMEEMHQEAVKKTSELGKLEGYTENEKEQVNELIGLGALKYFILKVDPKKRILFDPNESIEFNGNTGPFIQYTYARTCSVLRKSAKQTLEIKDKEINKAEQKLIILLSSYEELIEKSAADLNPALIANYIYEVSKEYNSFYQSNRILDAENESEQQLRLAITQWTGNVIRHGLSLLGIGAPERM